MKRLTWYVFDNEINFFLNWFELFIFKRVFYRRGYFVNKVKLEGIRNHPLIVIDEAK